MNIRRFTARTSRDALVLARQALGEDAVVLSTRPSPEGVELLAMAPEGMQQIERIAAQSAPAASSASAARPEAAEARPPRQEPSFGTRDDATEDVTRLSMSTLSFQDYVRERMLRRRQDAMKAGATTSSPPSPSSLSPSSSSPADRPAPPDPHPADPPPRAPRHAAGPLLHDPLPPEADLLEPARVAPEPQAAVRPALDAAMRPGPRPAAFEPIPVAPPAAPDAMLAELRAMKGLIEERFGALAWIEKLNRQPGQVRLIQKLHGCGFSSALIKRIGDSLPMDVADEAAWAAGVLERNLATAEAEPPLEDQGGVYALVGATGVGKTTTTAKIAAAFAAKYGAANLGLITLDAYRIGAHEQLRAYGRILGVPVHTAHDRVSLEDLLELLAGKKMVLIDTAGMAQRDTRTKELLEMVSHRSVKKLLVVNAASQGETIEDVMIAYQASTCAGLVLSKMDEAVKLGPALDAAIRMKVKVIGVANGQRVPEDWHRLGAAALVQRALRAGGSSAYRLETGDLSLVFTAPAAMAASTAPSAAAVRAPLHG